MARSHRRFVSYIDKSREYYAAQGYPQPYRWASFDDSPFTALAKPLSQCRVGVVTTAAIDDDELIRPYVAPADPAPDSLATSHLSWHKEATHTDDLGAFLPLAHLQELAGDAFIGEVSPRFYGVPTVYSQRRTMKNADVLREWLVEDDVDLALLIPL